MQSQANYKIFITDDDPFCTAIYEQQLMNLGFQAITTFSSGEELLYHLPENPELILLDYNLADANGLEMLIKIKRYNPAIDVVMVSGQSEMDTTIELLNNGAFDYIIKGDEETEKLSLVIGKWLSARELNKQFQQENGLSFNDKYTKTIVEAQDKVRKEISNELHDNVSQLLGATKLYIDMACQNEKNRLPLLQESKNILNTAITEIRNLSHSLQAVYMQQTDLQQEIDNIIMNLKKQNTFQLTTAVSLQECNNELTHEIQHNLVRIIQEQVNNISKYAAAKKVFIGVGKTGNRLHLTIKDDGVGFDPEKAKRGLGLSNILNRVHRLNGTCNIKAAPGEGCHWDIAIPV
jgi:two-component system sensor histidine kinase UhpB